MIDETNAPQPAPRRIRRAPRSVGLGSGGPIPLAKVLNAAKGRHRVVVLAGPPESGKTTIVSTIFNDFHVGPFAGYLFAGSSSLVALEERCHESRVESELDLPDTTRTSRAQVGELINISVGLAPTKRRSLMVNDVSGEHFEALVTRPSTASAMPVLSLAERFGVVVDGARLVDKGDRDKALYDAETLARAIIEYGQVRLEAMFDVVLTKLDLISEDGQLDDYVTRGVQRIALAVPPERRGDIILTSARSKSPQHVRSGTGLDQLFSLWVGERPTQRLALGSTELSPGQVSA